MPREQKGRGNNMSNITLRERTKIPTYDNNKHMTGGALNFDEEKCNQCGRCISVCPGACLNSESFNKMDYMEGKASGKCGVPYVEVTRDVTMCIACFCCGAACPRGAISIESHFNPGYYFKRISQTSDMKLPRRY